MDLTFDQGSCSTPLVYPCLYHSQERLCHAHTWSRDVLWTPDEATFPSLSFSEASNIGGNTSDSVRDVGPIIPYSKEYNGYCLKPLNLSYTESDELHHDFGRGACQYWGEGERGLITEVDASCPADGSSQSIDNHMTGGHAPRCRAKDDTKFACKECSEHFQNKSALDNHAKHTKHGAYECMCGITFTRHDVLNRHIQTFSRKNLYPCTYCFNFSGLKAFTRPDHLTQHLRGYHRMETSIKSTADPQSSLGLSTANAGTIGLSCSHADCGYHQAAVGNQASSPNLQSSNVRFRSQKYLTNHMREVHDESPYPCDVLNCNRTGGRGFCRKRDLLRHQKDHHLSSGSSLLFSLV